MIINNFLEGRDMQYLDIATRIWLKIKEKRLSYILFLILFLALGKEGSRAQNLSITTNVTPAGSPQAVGTSLVYTTKIEYDPTPSGPCAVSVTLFLNVEGLQLPFSGSTAPAPTPIPCFGAGPTSITLSPPVNNTVRVDIINLYNMVTISYTAQITNTHRSVVVIAEVFPTLFTEIAGGDSDNKNVLQTFIKPELSQPNDITICSGESVNTTLVADVPLSNYTWMPSSSMGSITVMPASAGGNIIRDIAINTGVVSGTLIYTITPTLVAIIKNPDGTDSSMSQTTTGNPKSFTVTVEPAATMASVAVSGGGVIYSNQNAVFTPSSGFASPTYKWYDSASKTNLLTSVTSAVVDPNGVLTLSNLSSGNYTYYVAASSAGFCEGPTMAAHITILPLPVQPEKDFTPNADARNDFWRIRDIADYPTCKIEVVDEWGSVVYRADSGYTDPWRGTNLDGVFLEVGTYYYIIDLKKDNLPRLFGSVSIIK